MPLSLNGPSLAKGRIRLPRPMCLSGRGWPLNCIRVLERRKSTRMLDRQRPLYLRTINVKTMIKGCGGSRSMNLKFGAGVSQCEAPGHSARSLLSELEPASFSREVALVSGQSDSSLKVTRARQQISIAGEFRQLIPFLQLQLAQGKATYV